MVRFKSLKVETTDEDTIWNGMHDKCVYLSEKALICKGKMRDTFSYLATTIAAYQVLEGTYTYPEGFDKATQFDSCIFLRFLLRPPLVRLLGTLGASMTPGRSDWVC